MKINVSVLDDSGGRLVNRFKTEAADDVEIREAIEDIESFLLATYDEMEGEDV